MLVDRRVRQAPLLEAAVKVVQLLSREPVEAQVPERRLDGFDYQASVLLDGVAGTVRCNVVEPAIDQLAQSDHVALGHFLPLDIGYEFGELALGLALGAGEVAGNVANFAVLAPGEDAQPPVPVAQLPHAPLHLVPPRRGQLSGAGLLSKWVQTVPA